MQTIRSPRVAIMGAGMTGIGLYIKLKESGINDILLFEKRSALGGTWRDNTYPGIACDVAAHLYAYSYEPNPNWSRRFAGGDEIQRYVEGVAQKYNVSDNILFEEVVTQAQYDGESWQLATSKGNHFAADFLFSATGILHHPQLPNIEGMEAFGGASFHSARWDHSVDLTGKKVGIIGTGSTAIQIATQLISEGADITVFQRTAQWILPVPNSEAGSFHKTVLQRLPFLPKWYSRVHAFLMTNVLTKALTGSKWAHRLLSYLCQRNLNSVKDPELKQKLTPTYVPGCKRIVVSEHFYRQIQKPNATVVTTGIDRICENGVMTVDGKLHELDVLVYATGFDPLKYSFPTEILSESGESLATQFNDGANAYRSLMLPNFPNFFLMLGPNTPIGNFSVTRMSEVQTNWALKIIQHWREGRFKQIEPTPQAVHDFKQSIKQGMVDTVWVSGCDSWYMDSQGDPILWPYSWQRWEREMKTPDLKDFALVS